MNSGDKPQGMTNYESPLHLMPQKITLLECSSSFKRDHVVSGGLESGKHLRSGLDEGTVHQVTGNAA